jgi:hypothetical protein
MSKCGEKYYCDGKVYECTCVKGHDGEHVCHDNSGRTVKHWRQDEEL